MQRLNEEPNVYPKESGLPAVIWVDDSDTPVNHSRYYIKIVPKNKPASGKSYEMDVSDNPDFSKTEPTLRDLNMESWELEQIKQWIKDNLALLRKTCEGCLRVELLLARPEYKKPRTKLELRSMRDGTSVVTGPASPTTEPVSESFLQYARRRMLNKQRMEFGLPPLP